MRRLYHIANSNIAKHKNILLPCIVLFFAARQLFLMLNDHTCSLFSIEAKILEFKVGLCTKVDQRSLSTGVRCEKTVLANIISSNIMKAIIQVLIAMAAFSQALSSIEKCFEEHEIVPDILLVAPKKIMNVSSQNKYFAFIFQQLHKISFLTHI